MVVELKLSRDENVPWGFRLAGGADYDIPLTVTKVKNEWPIIQIMCWCFFHDFFEAISLIGIAFIFRGATSFIIFSDSISCYPWPTNH